MFKLPSLLSPQSAAQPAPRSSLTSHQLVPNAPALSGGSLLNQLKRDTFQPWKATLFAPIPNVAPQLTPAQQTTLGRIVNAPAPDIGRKSLDALRESAGFQRLDEPTRTRVLQAYLDNEIDLSVTREQRTENAAALHALVNSSGFAALPAGLQTMCITTFERAGHEGKRALAALAERTVNGQPALASQDSTRTTLAARLALLALNTRSEFLDSALKDVAHPESIGVGINAQTQATHRRLASERPAELLRVLGDLASASHTATLADGTTTTIKSFLVDLRVPASGCSPTESVFQKAAVGIDVRSFIGVLPPT